MSRLIPQRNLTSSKTTLSRTKKSIGFDKFESLSPVHQNEAILPQISISSIKGQIPRLKTPFLSLDPNQLQCIDNNLKYLIKGIFRSFDSNRLQIKEHAALYISSAGIPKAPGLGSQLFSLYASLSPLPYAGS